MHDNASTTDEVQINIVEEVRNAFDGVEEFGRGNSPAVKSLLQGIGTEPEVVLACDAQQDTDNPFVYVRVFDAVDFGSAAVLMKFRDRPDLAYVGGSNEVYSALRRLAENDYCWTVRDTDRIAEGFIENNPYK